MAIGRPISLTPNVATQNFTVTATADQTSFTVTGGYRVNELGVYRNGVRLIQGKDFTASDGSTVTLLSGAVVDDVVEFQIFDSFNIANALVSYGNQVISGNLTVTKIIGDGSELTGIAATDNLNSNNIKVSGITTLGTTSTVVGSAVTFTASGGTIVGVLTATSFEGDGSSLTGVAATDYIVSNSLKVLGISTFSGEVTAAGGVDVTGGVKSAGIVTFTNTTASTSSATGALVVSGGVGIAGSLHVGENVSIGGTLTYEDVTNIDVIGIITARAGVLVNGGRGIDIAAGGLEVSGLSTFKDGLNITGSGVTITGTDTNNYVTIKNTTASDSSGARLSKIIFQGTQSGSEVTDLVHLAAMHDGGSDDQYGAFRVYINDGNDDSSPTERFGIGRAGEFRVNQSIGSAGQVIQSAGSGSPAVWADASSGVSAAKAVGLAAFLG